MGKQAFMDIFGGVYEHSPWIAETLWKNGVTKECDEAEGLRNALQSILLGAERKQQLEVLRAHPDLAGRAAMRNELTQSSTDEQASAGLDHCSEKELRKFQEYNEQYKSKFEFPFIMAVKDSSRKEILDAFSQRLNNNPEQEFQTALNEVGKIAKIRITDIFQQQ